VTNTPAPFSFRTDDGCVRGVADNILSALNGAWTLSRYEETVIIVADHRDHPEGVDVARVGVEWLDNLGAEDRDYEAELEELTEPEVPKVRHTSCKLCGLDVEVALDDIGLLTTDRGGEARCRDGRVHEPALEAEDYDAYEYHTGETVR
jgi:hypothetical protein